MHGVFTLGVYIAAERLEHDSGAGAAEGHPFPDVRATQKQETRQGLAPEGEADGIEDPSVGRCG